MSEQKMTQEEAIVLQKELIKELDTIESQLIDLSLEYNLELYLDGRGELLLEDNDWTGKYRGDWYTSTDSCS